MLIRESKFGLLRTTPKKFDFQYQSTFNPIPSSSLFLLHPLAFSFGHASYFGVLTAE